MFLFNLHLYNVFCVLGIQIWMRTLLLSWNLQATRETVTWQAPFKQCLDLLRKWTWQIKGATLDCEQPRKLEMY